ncbi:MAG TPA: hypothetical protein VLD37_06400 [Candidatus Bilamarchaeum sp.]|nr:hypothetical protein [Candidatus Bilamarchaeum sp.]
MQSLEALFSLMFFLSICTAILIQAEPKPLDDSLYRMELADDAWRVLSLRGDFGGFGEGKRPAVETDLRALGDMTGLCYFIQGINYTNCPGGKGHVDVSSLEKAVYYENTLRTVTFSVKK